MNVQELRTALHEHADHVEDIGASTRVAATHHRVAVVRRHRRAGVAAVVAATAVAVVTAGALTLLPDHQTVQPAEHTPPAKLAGYKVDRTYRPAPWTFRYVRGVQSAKGQSVLDLDVPASDRPRVIGWGVSTDRFSSRAATLSLDGRVIDSSGDGMWSTGDLLSPGRAHHLTVRFKKWSPESRSGIAVYDLVGKPPAGVSNGTSVFRQQMAGDRLLGARFGERGQREISFDVQVPDSRVSFSIACAGLREHAMADLSVNGSSVAGAGCQPAAQLDPGGNRIGPGNQGWGRSLGIKPGATLHVTLALHGKGIRRTDDLELGAAVYHDAPDVVHVAGWGIPELVEGPDGRLYRYTGNVQSSPGQRRLVLHLPASSHQRFVQYASSHAPGMMSLRISGQTADGIEYQDTGGGYGGGHELKPGRPYTISLTLRHGATPRTVLGLIISTRTE